MFGIHRIRSRLASSIRLNSRLFSTKEVYVSGEVKSQREDVITIDGLDGTRVGSMLTLEDGRRATVLSLGKKSVHAGLVGVPKRKGVRRGTQANAELSDVLAVSVGNRMLGRIVDGIGQPQDSLGEIGLEGERRHLFREIEPCIVSQKAVYDTISTGFKHIDIFHPIGKGQRLAILGPANVGKTTLALDIISRQHQLCNGPKSSVDDNMHFIYVCVGKSLRHSQMVTHELNKRGVMSHTTMVIANNNDLSTPQALSAFTGSVLGAYYRDNGKHAIVIYDDLGAHGTLYTHLNKNCDYTLSDVTVVHAKVLERAAQLSEAKLGGSCTAICLMETTQASYTIMQDAIAGYVDHCIFMDAKLAHEGMWPPIHVQQIIQSTKPRFQPKATRAIASAACGYVSHSMQLNEHGDLAKEYGFEPDDEFLPDMQYREKLQSLLCQEEGSSMSLGEQFLSVFASLGHKLLAHVNINKIYLYEIELHEYMKKNYAHLYEKLMQLSPDETLDKEFVKALHDACEEFDDQVRLS